MKNTLRNKRSLAILAVLAVSAVTATAALARPFFMGGHGDHSPEKMQKRVLWMVEDTLDDLDATDAQQAEVEGIVKRAMADLAPLHQGKEKAHEVLKAEWQKDQPDERVIAALLDEQAATHRQVADRIADAALEIHAVLDAGQRTQLLERFERHRGMH